MEAESVEDAAEATADGVDYIPPSVHLRPLLAGETYTHHSPVPSALKADPDVPVTLGVDEAGRGPVLGPMVYGLFFLPSSQHKSLLKDTHNFMDSKVLKASTRSDLMREICNPTSDLYRNCGWATTSISARDISAHMLSPARINLNAQAMDATIALIQKVLDNGVAIREIFVDTIGQPAPYQKRLEKLFPQARITVAKKADSLYPVVSAASVCAKVTRDVALDCCWRDHERSGLKDAHAADHGDEPIWGSGYPSDARCTTWLRKEAHPVFGYSNVCRFSWLPIQDQLDKSSEAARVRWPESTEEDEDNMRISDFMNNDTPASEFEEMRSWYGKAVGV